MAEIRVHVDEATGEVEVFTDATEADLDYLGGKALTEEFLARLGAKLGGDGLRQTSGIEQHKNNPGGHHSHITQRLGRG